TESKIHAMSIRLVPIERKPAEQQVTDNLRSYLLSGGVAAGSKLTETEVATHLGVSRATARSGMHRLAGEGILIQVPYTGWQVMPITPDDVWELWTLRGSLEGLAARLVCESMTDSRRQTILDSF